ncbi:hypothetical protein CFK37_09200 [Virgibacillus phasianinus]|uniref:SSD domain-containing protein n=1 Tax=Virgibacillus phasianinus TaxID=2017483 RepID=A0A220U2H1_9BACI|nr:MMPL family transporter [Virgibacillus phasianinus]ASK62319.1 hypothetical protein CFK37_09200 [Virgibacillus phasianinus]
MAKFLYKLGSSIAKHKWSALAAWVVILAAIVIPLIINNPEFDNNIKMNGLKSLGTNDKIAEEFNHDSEKATIRVVFKSDEEKGITDKDTMKTIQDALTEVKENDKHVDRITDPYKNRQINKDQTVAFADINYDVSKTSITDDSIENVKDSVNSLDDIRTELTGNALSANVEISPAPEIIGIVVAFVILLVAFGSLIAAGMPIISAVIGLGSSIGSVALLTYAFDIPNIALTLAVMIGLALGIDYALFILFRYREIIKTESDHVKAIGMALGTAGSAVIFAGVTVIIAVCGLALVGIDFLTVMGFASAISVLFAVLSALTLLPALISIFHKKIKPKRNKSANSGDLNTPWSKFVVGKPVIAFLAGLILLAALAIPFTHMRLGIPDNGMQPEDSTVKQAYGIMADGFGEGINGPIAMLADVSDKGNPEALQKDLSNMVEDLNSMDHVATVTKPQMSESKDYALISIIPEKGPNDESTYDLVHELRDYNQQAEDKYDLHTEISGLTVINIEMSEKLNDAIPLFAGVIILLAFVLLMVVFRSLIIPLKAVLGFVLSLAATLGFTTLIMQDGFISDLFGVSTTGPVLAFLPIITIGLLFGLAMDYEVFLMSRIHEEYQQTRDNIHSIKTGLKESGPVIVAAALIMFSVFIGFVFQDDIMIKSMGIALAFGVLFDAFIVRMMMVPALTALFGRASWYFPKWLDRILPKVDIEGHALKNEDVQKTTAATDDKSFSEGVYDNRQQTEMSYHHARMKNDEHTAQLYNDLVQNISKKDLLYTALLNYAKDHHEAVYHKFAQDYKNTTGTSSEQQDASSEALLKLLSQQGENIHELNELIKQNKISDQQNLNEETLKLLNQQGENIHELNELVKRIV